jgi:hypothetical protein
MEPVNRSELQQECLDKLSRALDLVLKTAETASAENNHKIVIQASREVTRLVTLINKINSTSEPKTKTGSIRNAVPTSDPVADIWSNRDKNGKSGDQPESLKEFSQRDKPDSGHLEDIFINAVLNTRSAFTGKQRENGAADICRSDEPLVLQTEEAADNCQRTIRPR